MPSQVINGVGKAGIRPATSSVATVDTDAQTFLTAAAITDTTQVNAVNELVLDLKAAGIWTKMKAIYPFVGGTPTKHKWNLKDSRDLNTAYRLVFNGGGTHSSTGYQPNGSTAYADTYLIPRNVLSDINLHISYYSRTQSSINGADMGSAQSNNSNELSMYGYYSAVSLKGGTCYTYPSEGVTHNTTNTKGLQIITRTASNVLSLHWNGSKLSTNTSTKSQTTPNVSTLIGSNRNGATPLGFSNRECAFASIGDGLTDLESNLFYQIVEKYQVALGRNINTTKSFYFNRNYSNETNAFIFNGSITGTTQQSAVNTLVGDLKSSGLWTKMKAIYPMVGGTATAHKFNLANPVDTNDAYRLTFNGGWTHSSTGALPNGTDGYANTYLIPLSASTLNSMSLSYYSRTNSTVGNVNEIGCWDGAGYHYTSLSIRHSSNVIGVYLQNTSVGLSTPNTDSRGFYFASLLSGAASVFKNNTKVASGTQTPTGRPNVPVWIGRANGNQPYYSNRECAFSSIGDGLTDMESNLFYQIVEKFQNALGRNINTTQPFYYSSGYTNETNAFINNGGITDATQISAVNTLVSTLKTAGVWSKMKAVYPMVGGTATTHKFNLVNPVDSDAAFRLTFVGGGTHSSTGYQPNGSNAYANTFLNSASHLSLTSTHISYYSRTNSNGTEVEIGSQTPSAPVHYLLLEIRTAGSTYFITNTSTVAGTSVSDANSLGHYIGNRTASNIMTGFKNASKVLNTTIASTSLSSSNVYLGALNNGTTAVNFTTKQCAFASIGDGLTDAEATTFYNAVQAFQTTLNRQV